MKNWFCVNKYLKKSLVNLYIMSEQVITEKSEQIEVVTYSNFEEVKKVVSSKYVTFMQNILKYIKDAQVDKEKHLKNYEKNMNRFVNNSDYEVIFRYFIQKFLHIMSDVVDKNIDLFLTEKPYVMKGKKKKREKRENSNATYLCPGNMLRYVFSSLRNPPKKNKVSRNQEISNIFDELLDIYRVFITEKDGQGTHLDDLSSFVEEKFSNSGKHLRYKDVLNNFNEILDEYVEEEEVSSDDEEEEEKEENEEEGDFFSNISNMLPGKNILEGSTIFKMAKELQDELKDELNETDMDGLNDPQKVMQSMAAMLQGNSTESGMGNTIGKVLGKLGEKMNDGSFPKDALQKDVENIAKSMGGLSKMFGGNLGSLFGGK